MNWDPTPMQRRLLFACVVALLTGVGIYLTAPQLFGVSGEGRGPSRRAAPAPSTRPAPDGTTSGVHTPSPAPTAPSSTVSPESSPSPSEVQEPYVRKALRFARAFTATDKSGEAWHAAVARHTTEDLGDALAYTDPAMVPRGRPSGKGEVRATGETAVEVAIPLDTGTELLITVIPEKGGYAVSSVSPGEAS